MTLQRAQLMFTIMYVISAAMGQYHQRQISLQEFLSPLNAELASEIMRMSRQANSAATNAESAPNNPPVTSKPHYIDPREYPNILRNAPPNLQSMSVPQNLAQGMQYPQNYPQFSKMLNLPSTQNVPQQSEQSQAKFNLPVSSTPVSVPQSQYDYQNIQQKPEQASKKQLPVANNFVLPSSEDVNKNAKRDLCFTDPFMPKMECNSCIKNKPFNFDFPVGEFPSFPQMPGFKENLCMNPLPSCSSCGFPSFDQKSMGNPFLPIASPVSSLFPPCSSMPPALPNNTRCQFLRKIPIPPPTL